MELEAPKQRRKEDVTVGRRSVAKKVVSSPPEPEKVIMREEIPVKPGKTREKKEKRLSSPQKVALRQQILEEEREVVESKKLLWWGVTLCVAAVGILGAAVASVYYVPLLAPVVTPPLIVVGAVVAVAGALALAGSYLYDFPRKGMQTMQARGKEVLTRMCDVILDATKGIPVVGKVVEVGVKVGQGGLSFLDTHVVKPIFENNGFYPLPDGGWPPFLLALLLALCIYLFLFPSKK